MSKKSRNKKPKEKKLGVEKRIPGVIELGKPESDLKIDLELEQPEEFEHDDSPEQEQHGSMKLKKIAKSVPVKPILANFALVVMCIGVFWGGWLLGGALGGQNGDGPGTQNAVEEQLEPVESSEGAETGRGTDEEKEGESEASEGEESQEEKTEENAPESETTGNSQSFAEVAAGVIPEPDATGKKLIALTFDDGPSSATTDRLLDILRQKQVRATFFVLGNMAERFPQIVQRQVSDGHEVGSHSRSHTAFSKMTPAELASDVAYMNQLFTNILGHPTPFMRPPYGDGMYTDKARTTVGQPMIIWTVDTLDWKYRNVETVRQNAVKDAFDGAIILFHDIHPTTVDAIPLIIDDLRAQGYEFLTVSALARAKGTVMQSGAVYGRF